MDTGLSPPPSSNNSNVDDQNQQPMLKPLHINNNIPSSYPTTTSSSTTSSVAPLTTNTPTPPSSAEAISPSSVSSGKKFFPQKIWIFIFLFIYHDFMSFMANYIHNKALWSDLRNTEQLLLICCACNNCIQILKKALW